MLTRRAAQCNLFTVDAHIAKQGHFATQRQLRAFNRDGLTIARRVEINGNCLRAYFDVFAKRCAQTIDRHLGVHSRKVDRAIKALQANSAACNQSKARFSKRVSARDQTQVSARHDNLIARIGAYCYFGIRRSDDQRRTIDSGGLRNGERARNRGKAINAQNTRCAHRNRSVV